MKKIYSLLVLVLTASMALGQYYYIPPSGTGNPGGLNNEDAEFPVGSGLPNTWTSILGGSNASPAWSSVQTIPFAFNFNGSAVTQYKVSSSGVLTFSTGATAVPSYTNAAIPNAGIPDNSVMVWGIEGTGSNDEIVTQTFGTAPNRQHWVFFTSYTAVSWTYWSIVLEEGTDRIYIVDMRHSTSAAPSVTAGIQINNTTATSVAGSPSLGNLAGSNSADDDNYYYTFVYGSQPTWDMSVISESVPNFLILGQAPFNISGETQNLGGNTVTGYDINYRVNGGATVTSAISPGSMATFDTHAFTSGQGWTPASAGSYTIDLWASNLNGNPDDNTGNDTLTFSVSVVDTFVPRKVLFETYTSSTCGPCVPANQTLEGLFTDPSNAGKFTSLKFQMSWPGAGDPYYTAEGGLRRNYYGINSIPRVEIDGGFDGNGNNVTQAILDDAANIPSFVTLDAEFERSGTMGESISIDVQITPVADITSNDLVLYMAIYEDRTVNNVASNGETEFFNVMKKMVPDEGGIPISALTNGTVVNQSGSYTFQGQYRLPANALSPINHTTEHSVENFANLEVVVWLQDLSTKEVFQSAYATDVTMVSNAPERITGLQAVAYPNPNSGLFNLKVNSEEVGALDIQVMNSLGQIVVRERTDVLNSGEHVFPLDISGLESGLYFYEVKAGEQSVTGKVILNQ